MSQTQRTTLAKVNVTQTSLGPVSNKSECALLSRKSKYTWQELKATHHGTYLHLCMNTCFLVNSHLSGQPYLDGSELVIIVSTLLTFLTKIRLPVGSERNQKDQSLAFFVKQAADQLSAVSQSHKPTTGADR